MKQTYKSKYEALLARHEALQCGEAYTRTQLDKGREEFRALREASCGYENDCRNLRARNEELIRRMNAIKALVAA